MDKLAETSFKLIGRLHRVIASVGGLAPVATEVELIVLGGQLPSALVAEKLSAMEVLHGLNSLGQACNAQTGSSRQYPETDTWWTPPRRGVLPSPR